MSNILLDERLIAFIPSLAREIGTNEAIVLQQINYWIQRSTNIHDGKRWVYNTTKDWVEKEFCFMSESTLKRTIASLKKMKLIESKKLSKHTGYHINFYTINEKEVQKIDAKIKKRKMDELRDSIGSDCASIGSDCTNEKVRLNQSTSGQIDTAITESTTRLLTDTKESSPSAKKPANDKFKPVKPEQVSDQTWNDLLALRKKKRAVESQTAWTRINNSIERAQQETGHTLENIFSYWVMRAWAGFDEKWYINAHPQPTNTYQGNNHANHQSANHSNQQPKQSSSSKYDEQLAQELSERYPDEFPMFGYQGSDSEFI